MKAIPSVDFNPHDDLILDLLNDSEIHVYHIVMASVVSQSDNPVLTHEFALIVLSDLTIFNNNICCLFLFFPQESLFRNIGRNGLIR